MNDIELCQELMKRAEEYQKRKAREFAIEELKKIKAEIMATGNWKSEYEISDRGVIKAVEVIDNHISELKGENNEI